MNRKKMNQEEFDKQTEYINQRMCAHLSSRVIKEPKPRFLLGEHVWFMEECNSCESHNVKQIVQGYISSKSLRTNIDVGMKSMVLDQDTPIGTWMYGVRRYFLKEGMPRELELKTHGMGFYHTLERSESQIGKTKEEVKVLICKSELVETKMFQEKLKSRELHLKRELTALEEANKETMYKPKPSSYCVIVNESLHEL